MLAPIVRLASRKRYFVYPAGGEGGVASGNGIERVKSGYLDSLRSLLYSPFNGRNLCMYVCMYGTFGRLNLDASTRYKFWFTSIRAFVRLINIKGRARIWSGSSRVAAGRAQGQ